MDSTISIPKTPSLPLSGLPKTLPPSRGGRVGTSPALSLERTKLTGPHLVPGAGSIEKLGATITPEGVNFAVYSEAATAIWVSLYDEQDQEIERIELDVYAENIRAGLVAGIGAGARYGLRADGRYDPDQGYFFDPHK
ncbi:MAG: hypothetical protein J0I64_06600, partial [Devosia sp.]|nr:hypothetical protein [Devosia sp.]